MKKIFSPVEYLINLIYSAQPAITHKSLSFKLRGGLRVSTL